MNPSHSYAWLALLFILTLMNAFFTLAETALTTVRNARLQQMVTEGGRDAGAAGECPASSCASRRAWSRPCRSGLHWPRLPAAAIAAATLAPELASHFARLVFAWHPVLVSPDD